MDTATRDSLHYALRYAERGMRVFPVRPDGKEPCHQLIGSWAKEATTDPRQIRQWFDAVPEANVGIATGEWDGHGTLFVVDIDVKGEKSGYETWERLRAEHSGEAPEPTLSAETPSGGSHLYYTAPPSVKIKSAEDNLGKGVDTKGHGGYVVAPPSNTSSGEYAFWDGTEKAVEEAPYWLVSSAYKPGQKPGTTHPRREGQPNPEVVEEALQAIPAQPDYDTWIRVIAAVKDGASSDQEAARMLEEWSPEDRGGDYTYEERVQNAPDERITVGTLFHLAQEHAWMPPWQENGRSKEQERAPTTSGGIGTLASEVDAEPVEWLWTGRVPLGELTILDGDPGTGKSTLLVSIAAHLTTGRGLPGHKGEPTDGGAVYVTTEDSPARTIRPRLEAAGANTDRVLLVPSVSDEEGEPRPLVLPDDVTLLEQGIRRVGARLVIIDPLMAHLGGSINAHRDADVRRALAPLADLAHRLGVAVVVVRHLNKSGGNAAIYRGGGSIGIIGAARVGLLLAEHPDQEEVRVLAPVKNNLAVFPPSLALGLEQAEGRDVARVEWLGRCDLSADQLLEGSGQGRSDDKRQEARDFLHEILSDGPVPAQEVKDTADENGIMTRTLRRAKESLNVEKEKNGFQGPWMWKLPPDETPF